MASATGDPSSETQRLLAELSSLLEESKTEVARIAASREKGNTLSRQNAKVQDHMAALRSKMRDLEILAEEVDGEAEAEHLTKMAVEYKNAHDRIRLSLREANLAAKANLEKAAREERELLFAGGEKAAQRRKELQTQADLAFSSESVTESLRRTRQLMAQEVEHQTSTLATMVESGSTLKRAEEEFTGQRSLFSSTRRLLSQLESQGTLDRIIIWLGCTLFLLACFWVVSRRLGMARFAQMVFRGTVNATHQLAASHNPKAPGEPIVHVEL